jgi:hypothetical protein
MNIFEHVLTACPVKVSFALEAFAFKAFGMFNGRSAGRSESAGFCADYMLGVLDRNQCNTIQAAADGFGPA